MNMDESMQAIQAQKLMFTKHYMEFLEVTTCFVDEKNLSGEDEQKAFLDMMEILRKLHPAKAVLAATSTLMATMIRTKNVELLKDIEAHNANIDDVSVR